jgi:acetolactate synthase-1/2/3 large subunit
MYGRAGFRIPGKLVRIDIEADQLVRNAAPDLRLHGDAAAIVPLLVDRLGSEAAHRDGRKRVAETRRAAFEELSPAMRRQVEFLAEIRAALPGAVIVGDSTQPVYAGNLFHAADQPAGWFNSATGYGTLGYALSAAIGAKLGAPEGPVVCLAGDGGLQFTLAELGSAMDARTPIIVLVWNNRGYGEIKDYMQARGIAPEGVDLTTPDFCAIASAYGLAAERLKTRQALGGLLKAAAVRPIPTLIEIDEAVVMSAT